MLARKCTRHLHFDQFAADEFGDLLPRRRGRPKWLLACVAVSMRVGIDYG
jgi:hypothetical protein